MDDRAGELIRAARSGDRAAFEALFGASAARVLVFARAKLGGQRRSAAGPGGVGPSLSAEVDEEDLLHDVYVAALAEFERFRGEDLRTFQAWLCTIAAHRIADRGRRIARGPRRTAEGFTRAIELASDPRSGPFTAAARRDQRTAVAEAVAALPEDERLALLAHHFEGLTHAEAAARFGVSPSTVQRRVAAALLAVGRALRAASEGGEL